MSYKFESEVIKALGELLKVEANYDVIIYIGKEPDFKEFHAHSNILRSRSDYFNKILGAKDIEKKHIIKKPNITPQAFDIIIKYLYTGHFNITNKTGIEILNIMIASDDLNLNQLIKVAEDYLVENQQRLRIDPVEIFQIVYYHQTFNTIQKFCLETICFKPEILFNSVKFIDLPAPALEEIVKRDDLNLIEIEIWENLIKWGLAQESNLSKDVSEWHQEEFNELKKILHRFIPFIRFYEISSEDYFNKIKPYENILSKELRDDILKFHMIPGYKPTLNKLLPRYYVDYHHVDSKIINQRHFILFANWINRKEDNSRYINAIPYEFKLIFRGSRDGFDHVSFHNKCDSKGENIVIIKIKNSNQIVGGYNPLNWVGVACKNTTDGFIFSFDDYRNINTGRIGRPIDTTCAVISDPGWGPVFGRKFINITYKCDLSMNSNGEWTSTVCSYPNIGIPNTFEIDDYEVFQIRKKSMIRDGHNSVNRRSNLSQWFSSFSFNPRESRSK